MHRLHLVMSKVAVVALLVCLCFLLCACVFGKLNDNRAVKDNLPQLDPYEGIPRKIDVKLYYALLDTNMLVGLETRINVAANDYALETMLNTLISSRTPARGLRALIPPTTKIIDISHSDDITFVTLNDDFISVEEWYENIAQRRLAYYSVINTVSAYENGSRVQILIDRDGDDAGERVMMQEFGLRDSEGRLSEPEPCNMEYEIDPAEIVIQAMYYLTLEDYDNAAALFFLSDNSAIDGARLRQALDVGETSMRVISYATSEVVITGNEAVCYVTVSFRNDAGELARVSSERVVLFVSDGMYRIELEGFEQMLDESMSYINE